MGVRVLREPVIRFTAGDGFEWECLLCGEKWTRRLLDDAAREALDHQRVVHGGESS